MLWRRGLIVILLISSKFIKSLSFKGCQPPKLPSHSRSVFTAQKINGLYPPRSTWLLRCLKGFKRIGPTTRPCLNGRWQGSSYQCLPNNHTSKQRIIQTLCAVPTVPPGSRVTRRPKFCCSLFFVLRYKCKRGLKLYGNSRITCQRNGHWSNQPPSCHRRFMCLNPPSIQNGKVSFKKKYPRVAGYGPGDVARYSCDPGYYMENHTFNQQDVTCTRRERWSDAPYLCKKLVCRMPAAPKNGYIVAENRSEFYHGDVIRYGCQVGYNLIGIRERSCDSFIRGWNMWKPICKKQNCPDPGFIENGRRIGYNFSVGAKVSFYCSSGYFLSGSAVRTCLKSLIWSGSLTTCQNSDYYCPDPGIQIGGIKIGRRYNLGDKVKFKCKYNFNLLGSSERECLINRAWSGSPAYCQYLRSRDSPKDVGMKIKEKFDYLADFTVDGNSDDSEFNANLSFSHIMGRSLKVGRKPGLDIYFVFDVSGSINNVTHFKLAVDFATVLIDKIGMSKHNGGTRVGILTFDDKVNILLAPYDSKTLDEAKKILSEMKYTGGGTSIAAVLRSVSFNLIPTSTMQMNPKPHQALILITDGDFNMGGNPSYVANLLKTQQKVDVYCVGIGNNVDKKMLLEISSENQTNVLSSYEELHKVTDWFLNGELDYSECGIRYEGGLPGADLIQDGWFSHDIREWPWMASIHYYMFNNGPPILICGGTVLNKEWILTAGHCFLRDKNEVNKIEVRLGQHNISFDENEYERREVREIIFHSKYKRLETSYDYDIALLRLLDPIVFNPRIRPICLPTNITDETLNKLYKPGWNERYVLGWGSNETVAVTHRAKPVDILKAFTLPLRSDDVCRQSLKRGTIDKRNLYTERMFCAGSEERDTCHRDSGGPLMAFVKDPHQQKNKVYQIGIVSWSMGGCKLPRNYGFYSKVSEYLDWIETAIEDYESNINN